MYNMDFDSIIKNLYEGVYVVDSNRKIVFWNSGAEKITGYMSKEVVNAHCYNNILRHVDSNGNELCHNGCPLHHTLQTGEINENDVFLHHKLGHRVPVSVKTMPLYDNEGNIVASIEVFTDSRFKKDNFEENRKLKELLVVDPLTEIYNRRYLDFHLENVIRENDKFDVAFGVLFFDIDLFKNVNDTYGHIVGDGVLKTIAATIKSNLRGDDIVGRWGGEEFIAVVRRVDEKSLKILAEKLRLLCASSVYDHNSEISISVTVSIGGTVYTNGETMNELIERADNYMYQSKQTGRNKSTIK